MQQVTLRQLKDILATEDEINILSGATVTTGDLNGLVGLTDRLDDIDLDIDGLQTDLASLEATVTNLTSMVIPDLGSDITDLSADLVAHISDAADAHDASAISVVPAGSLASTTVQAGLEEIQGDVDDLIVADQIMFDAGVSGSAKTLDWDDGSTQQLELTDDVDLTLSNPRSGRAYVLKIIQDSMARAITWPMNVFWPGGTEPTLSAAEGDIDIITFFYDGTSYYGSSQLDFS